MTRKLLALVTLLLAVASQAARLDASGFIRDWLLLGPFPSCLRQNTYDGLTRDFLAPFGGEFNCQARAGQATQAVFPADTAKLIAGIGSTNEWGQTKEQTIALRWTPIRVQAASGHVILDKRHPVFDDYIVTYALAFLESPVARDVKLLVGSDDDFRVILNGQKVGESATSQGINAGQFIYKAKLKRGINTLLFKCVDRTQGYGFCVALSDLKDAPLTDITVLTADPREEIRQAFKLAETPQGYDRGVWALFSSPTPQYFKGDVPIRLTIGSKTPASGKAKLRILRHTQTIATFERKLSITDKPVRWEETAKLGLGAYTCVLEFNGARVEYQAVGYDPKAVKNGIAAYQKKIADIEHEIRTIESQNATLEKQLETLKTSYRARQIARETSLQGTHDQRAAALPAALNAPIPAAPDGAERTVIELNGDMWQISRNGTDWKTVRLPRQSVDGFFRTWNYPVKRVNDNQPYGPVVSLPGLDNYTFDDSLTWNAFRVATDITLPDPARRYVFCCDCINGTADIYWNGIKCGEHRANIGPVRIALPQGKEGVNRLELRYTQPKTAWKISEPEAIFAKYFGITGNLRLESSKGAVTTAFADVTANWLDSAIRVQRELQHDSDQPADIRLERYCVLDGVVHYRFPSTTLTLPAGQTTVNATSGAWKDIQWWGIGGKYGAPTLYTLVSDIYQGDTLIDRHTQTFGCRDFRIIGEAFYLNGKYIILQGDVGGGEKIEVPKAAEIIFGLLRQDNINTIRSHDAMFTSVDFLDTCDRIGMLAYANMYPILHTVVPRKDITKFTSYDEWLQHDLHQLNLHNYRQWVRMLRNHPSVVILSTDNEIWTQAWDTPQRLPLNLRNDRLGALYGQYVKKIAPDFIVTRDGDVGTQGNHPHFREDPPCDVPNYHYPEFNFDNLIPGWQKRYGHRPLVLGETIYFAYGAWNKWCGALPGSVSKQALKVRNFAGKYQTYAVPGQIYMGDSLDGFIVFDESGKGNPWGVTATQHDRKSLPGYPWRRVNWPSATGPGLQPEYVRCDVKRQGLDVINWFDPTTVTHIRNAVNDAYRDTLMPMPPCAPAPFGECILTDLPAGALLQCRSVENALLTRYIRADKDGRAWVQLPAPGQVVLTCGETTHTVEAPAHAETASKPGFDAIRTYSWSTLK